MFNFKEQSNTKKRNLLIVATLLITTLVVGGITADLLQKEFDIAWITTERELLIAEVPQIQPEPTPPPVVTTSLRPAVNSKPLQTTNTLPIMASPRIPPVISTTAPPQNTRGIYTVNTPNPTGNIGSGRTDAPVSDSSSSEPVSTPIPITSPPPPPTPRLEPTPTPVPRKVSGGALQGKIVENPKPIYPPAARAVRQQGAVVVWLVLDERGRVESITSVSGPDLLKSAAVNAAKRARFTPTTLSSIPVKVTGYITYNFVL